MLVARHKTLDKCTISKSLKVWQLSRALVKDVYVITAEFPVTEKFGLVSQLRRCVVSIPTNIAEGAGRNTDKDFAYFLNIGLGSAFELDTLLILSFDVGLISEDQLNLLSTKISEIQKMTHGLIKSLRQESYV